MIGGADWHAEKVTVIEDKHVRSLGYINEKHLPPIFRLATVFAFPSLYEGFGLTVLEAMASETPVVASNTTSIPEAAGEAAILINPESVADMTGALEKLLSDPNARDLAVTAGKEQVKRFSWTKSTALLHEILTRQGNR